MAPALAVRHRGPGRQRLKKVTPLSQHGVSCSARTIPIAAGRVLPKFLPYCTSRERFSFVRSLNRFFSALPFFYLHPCGVIDRTSAHGYHCAGRIAAQRTFQPPSTAGGTGGTILPPFLARLFSVRANEGRDFSIMSTKVDTKVQHHFHLALPQPSDAITRTAQGTVGGDEFIDKVCSSVGVSLSR